MMRRWLALLAVVIVMGVLAYAHAEARRMPMVKTASIAMTDWPAGAPPLTVALIADIHLGNSAMDPARLRRIVDDLNRRRPDLVLIAGDFVFGHDPGAGARAAPILQAELSRLKSPLGVVAVLGNHDLWTGQGDVRAALERAGIVVLQNDAVQRGPLVIAGIADSFTGQDAIGRAWARARRLTGARIVLTHSPDLYDRLPKEATVLLAGHTHCGQVSLPWYGAIDPRARLHYSCGYYQEARLRTVVTGGLGASGVPLRLWAPPDEWLIALGPA